MRIVQSLVVGAASGTLMLLSEISPDAMSGIVSSLGVLGVLVWYLYYTTTKTLPDLNKSHNEAMQNIVIKHNESVKQITDSFEKSLLDERNDRRQELDTLKQWIKAEASCQYNRDHPRG